MFAFMGRLQCKHSADSEQDVMVFDTDTDRWAKGVDMSRGCLLCKSHGACGEGAALCL